MSKSRKRKKAIRWARYFNRYAHSMCITVGGWSCVRAMNVPGKHWMYVRRQQKHRFDAGRWAS